MSNQAKPTQNPDASRLVEAERRGLRLAILCRTVAVGAALVWFIGGWSAVGQSPSVWGLFALTVFFLLGVLHLRVIGTRFDRPWMKFAVYAVDILGMCAMFVLVPVSRTGEVPQILAFRGYGIYYLFPLISMSALSLSWRLVLWSGTLAAVGWWAAFLSVALQMDRRLSWADIPAQATREHYETIFLSIDFVGWGNRVEETGFIFIASAILALAVYRARQVFFAQLAAEDARERVASMLGRYVPEAVARRLLEDEAALAPQVRHGVALVLDVADFTGFSSGRDPKEVIDTLNRFLADSADAISDAGGVVITFTGDGLLATFNTPLAISEPERAALNAAVALVERAGDHGFRVRVGIAAGPIASGSIGSQERQAFTVYGETVNRAARLEEHAKRAGAVILTDGAVAEQAGDGPCDLVPAGEADLRGIAGPVRIHKVAL